MSEAPAAEPFSVVEPVRFGDLDAMQHLNNVQFLRYFETARIEYLGTLLPEHTPTRRQSFGFIFAECHISYRAPAHFGEHVRTAIRPGRLGNASFRLEFTMTADEDGRLLAEGYGVLVGYDYEAGRSKPIPDVLRDRLERPAAQRRPPRLVP